MKNGRCPPTCDKKSVNSMAIESILIAPPQICAMPSEAFVRCDKALSLFLSCSKSFFLFYLGLSPTLRDELTRLFHLHGSVGHATEGRIWLWSEQMTSVIFLHIRDPKDTSRCWWASTLRRCICKSRVMFVCILKCLNMFENLPWRDSMLQEGHPEVGTESYFSWLPL